VFTGKPVYNKSLLRARWQHFNIEPDKRRLGEDPLARIFHKGIEQKSGRSVRKLENTELYDDTLYRPEHHRL
jgi:hypothetical protein